MTHAVTQQVANACMPCCSDPEDDNWERILLPLSRLLTWVRGCALVISGRAGCTGGSGRHHLLWWQRLLDALKQAALVAPDRAAHIQELQHTGCKVRLCPPPHMIAHDLLQQNASACFLGDSALPQHSSTSPVGLCIYYAVVPVYVQHGLL